MRPSFHVHDFSSYNYHLVHRERPPVLLPLTGHSVRKGDALVIIDVQNDFFPGGPLEIPCAGEILPPLNRCSVEFQKHGLPVFVTRQWHPKNHCSFNTQGGPWPAHCVQFTCGAAFPAGLSLPQAAIMVSKPAVADRVTFSAFDHTDFDRKLRSRGVRTLFVGGVPAEYSVLHTVVDALRRGFKVLLLAEATRPLELNPGDGRSAYHDMCVAGAVPLNVSQLVECETFLAVPRNAPRA